MISKLIVVYLTMAGLAACPPATGMVDETPPPAASQPEQPPAETTAPVVNTQEEQDPAVALLDTLEQSARDLHTFTASIHYEVIAAFVDSKVIRKGELIYRVEPVDKKKSFAILFDTEIADNRKRERLNHYIFSDRWFVEVDHQEKLFIKREVVEPGEDFDPLKLGEGPFPLPIGQARDDVLARFDVSLIELPDYGPLAKLRGKVEVDGLLLTPKPKTQAADDYKRIALFYDRETRLPIGVEITEINDNRKTARLGDLQRNVELDADAMGKLSIASPDSKDWHIDIRPLQ